METAHQAQLHSQECFGWLSIPERQHVGFMQEALDQCGREPLFRSGSTGSSKSVEMASVTEEQAPYNPVNFISDEARALLFTYETALVAGNVACHDLMMPSTVSHPDTNEPLRILANLAPPKRFFRTFWRSISIRMLRQANQRLEMLCAVENESKMLE